MKLSEVLRGIDVLEWNGEDIEVTNVTADTAAVSAGALFVCIAGAHTDTHELWERAAAAGAVAFVAGRRLDAPFTEVIVTDTRAALSRIAANFYGRPASRLRTVAVVGTNGKTTTSHIVRHILASSGDKVCLIGTNGYSFDGDDYRDTGFTTPDPLGLQRILAAAVTAGCRYAVAEVSAHAIALEKTDGIVFDVGIFTNLSRDHLDFFGDMRTYADTKASFFTPAHVRRAVVNSDDALGREIASNCLMPVLTYGVENPADVFAINYSASDYGTAFVVNAEDDIYDVATPLHGRYNMSNALAAIACCHLLGFPLATMAAALGGMPQVPGRYQTFRVGEASVVVDYAHTPDGLAKLLDSVREWAEGRVICVFGCGGDRDATKRPLMAAAAEARADELWLTSDNPRYEDPEAILDQVERGLCGRIPAHRVTDRAAAIRAAAASARTGDVVAVCGKGNEPYLDVRGVKQRYCDLDVVRALEASC